MWASRDASERITDYYSYLFTFPSRGAMIAVITAISAAGCGLAFALAWGPASALRGLLYGLLGLTAPLLASDALASALFRDEAFLTPRRFTIISYASSIVYVAVILVSSSAAAFTGLGDILARGVLFAVTVNALLRYLAIAVFSTKGRERNLAVTLLQPALCFAASVLLFPISGLRLPAIGALGVAITVGGVRLLLWVMGRWEDTHRGLRLIPLFRAFILAWAEELNEPLEDQITRVGEVRDLSVDALIYSDSAGDCRAALVVPYIHPGPFRNVGGSILPKVLSERLSERLGCEVLVPHGISTHESDLTRSGDAERVAEAVSSSLRVVGDIALASPVVWVKRGGAQVACQMFGDIALITLTLSPKSYDDLPVELGERITEAAAAMGVTATVVDAHNSIQQENMLSDSDVDNLYHTAVEAIKDAKEAPRHAFSIGAARVVPREWGLDDGMGPCGVAALAVSLENGQSCVYVVVDGNNMRSGLRERIIAALRPLDVDSAEVLTSDTHLVNAIGATTRGYYPIGERIDEQKLIEYVVDAVEGALSNLGACRASFTRTVVPDLTVLGEAGLNLLSNVLESAFGLFKRTATVVVPVSMALAAAVIFLL